MAETRKISGRLEENVKGMELFFCDCADIKKKRMKLGKDLDTDCYLTYLEVSVDMGTSALGETLKYL